MPCGELNLQSVKLVVFDFDQTITVEHVFKTLQHKEAASELGQMRMIDELNDAGEYRDQGGFALWAVGGTQRLAQIQSSLTMLRERGVRLVVCTFGLVGPVKKVLDQLGLLEFFSEVYGFGPNKYKPTAYDKRVAERAATEDEVKFSASPELYNWKLKGEIIARLRSQMRISKSEVIFIDNDINMLSDASGMCWTIWVKMNHGMLQDHLDEIDWRTRPTRLPSTLLFCLEPLAVVQLYGRTSAQLREGAEGLRGGSPTLRA